VPIKRPIFRYALLAFLFAITVAYEVPYLHDILRDETRSVPFFAMEVASNRVNLVTREAVQAGIRQGDEVLSIDGRPYNGAGDWGHAVVDEAVGGNVTVVCALPIRRNRAHEPSCSPSKPSGPTPGKSQEK
jgi:membrane-associated protease RseP (regulator of RpoE activity)